MSFSATKKSDVADPAPAAFPNGSSSKNTKSAFKDYTPLGNKLSVESPDTNPTAAGKSETVRHGKSSREGSPIRPNPRSSNSTPANRSRKNSDELSPSRIPKINGSLSSIPSAAAVQRAMSAQRPLIPPTSPDGPADSSRVDKVTKSGHNSPSWPISPRLRSPPPSASSARSASGLTKKLDSESIPPNTSLKRLAPVSAPELGALMEIESNEDDMTSPSSGLRSPGRGVSATASLLETVAESSIPSTPSIGPVTNPYKDPDVKDAKLDSQAEESATKDNMTSSNESISAAKENNSESESTTKTEAKLAAATRPSANNLAKRSFTNLAASKSRAAATEPTRTMTVETETVNTIPQILGGERGMSGRDGNGSVRNKPSSETIRPKKDKKKIARKPPSLHAGTVTSKADIFEAKVASAVDEADTSDSDETFVYESNPQESRPSRNHSRTPSGASANNPQEHQGRNKHGIRSGSQGVGGKRSMKFTSSAFHNNMDGEHGPSDSLRGNPRNATSTPRHHHIGRYGRPSHTSLFDQDSPFSQANRPSSPRTSVGNMAKLSRPNSPRIAGTKLTGSPRKGETYTYDVDDDAADDERTPLMMGSVRVSRSRHSRRPNSVSLRQTEYFEADPRGCFSGWGCCALATILLMLLSGGIGTFIVAVNRPLMDVTVKHIQNVLASEQELMLDLDVRAINPNIFAISVSDLDVNLFAESAHVGTADDWRKKELPLSSIVARRPVPRQERGVISISNPWWWPDDGVDEGTDPIDDPESGVQKMLLGRIFEFDSPLIFDASPLRRVSTSSVGEIRLAKPGNKTEEGGTARWERVLQHPFDLIVRGVLKYQLPISSKTSSAKISARIKILPDQEESPGNDTTSSR